MSQLDSTQKLLVALVVLLVVQVALVLAFGFTTVTRFIAIVFFLLYFALVLRQRRES